MLLHLLVLAPFAAAILMMATSKEDSKSSSRLAFLFGFTFVAFSIALIAAGNQATEAIEWFRIPGAKGSVYFRWLPWLRGAIPSNTITATSQLPSLR